MKYALLAIPLILAVLAVGYLDRPPTEKEQVYNACIRARKSYTIFNDNYCGALQDDYRLKFVCDRESEDNIITNQKIDDGELPESSREVTSKCKVIKGE